MDTNRCSSGASSPSSSSPRLPAASGARPDQDGPADAVAPSAAAEDDEGAKSDGGSDASGSSRSRKRARSVDDEHDEHARADCDSDGSNSTRSSKRARPADDPNDEGAISDSASEASGSSRSSKRTRSDDDLDGDSDSSDDSRSSKRIRSAKELDADSAMSEKRADDVEAGKSAADEEVVPSEKGSATAEEEGAPAIKNEKKRVHEDDPDEGSGRENESKKHAVSSESRPAAEASEDDKKDDSLPTDTAKDMTKEQETNAGAPSAAAFAKSGFSAFSSAAISPFGAFKTTGQNGTAASTAPGQGEKSSFATAAKKTFGSGFGGLGGNFGSGGLQSFASGGVGLTAAAPIGGAGDDDEAGDAEDESQGQGEDGPQDDRFYKQTVETGEEGEEATFTARAKLYIKGEAQWKERGIGTFKLNVVAAENGEGDAVTSARFIMRADGTQKMLMNSAITANVKIEDRMGGEVKSKSVTFMGFVNGKPTLCLLQMKSADLAEELAEKTEEVKERMAA